MIWLENQPAAMPAGAGCAAPAAHPPRRRDVGLSTSHIRPHTGGDLWQVNAYRGGSLIQVCAPSVRGDNNGGGKRGIITRFSGASRRRLMRALAKTKRTLLPVFVTLTYPDNFPGDPNVWKLHLKAWLKRLKREHPKAAGFWKLELKPRQSGENAGRVAPHFHLLLWGLPLSWNGDDHAREIQVGWMLFNGCGELNEMTQKSVEVFRDGVLVRKTDIACVSAFWTNGVESLEGKPEVIFESISVPDKQGHVWRKVERWVRDERIKFGGEVKRVKGLMGEPIMVDLRAWLSWNWYEVVGSNDPRHLRAGTNVEAIRSREGVMYYASKYVCKLDTESADGCGRFWGIHNRTEIPWAEIERVPVDGKQALRLMRIARRYIWTQQRQREHPKKIRWRGGCGMSFFCDATAWLERLPGITSR